MLNDSTYYLATAAAQAIMGRDTGLKVDGIWGSKTDDAFKRASAETQAQVSGVVRVLTRADVAELRKYREAQRAYGKATASAAAGNVRKLIQGYALEEGVPFETALKIFNLESPGLRPNLTSPTGAAGLGQLTTIAIKDIRKHAGYTVVDPFDVHQNIIGSLKYMKLVARDMGVALTETAKVYMGYNIGPSGAKLVYAGKPERVADLIRVQAYGPDPKLYQAKLEAAVRAA